MSGGLKLKILTERASWQRFHCPPCGFHLIGLKMALKSTIMREIADSFSRSHESQISSEQQIQCSSDASSIIVDEFGETIERG